MRRREEHTKLRSPRAASSEKGSTRGRSARMAFMGGSGGVYHTDGDPFAALPHAVALRVFGGVPVEQRLRSAEVCRGWYATLSDAALWTELDLRRRCDG